MQYTSPLRFRLRVWTAVTVGLGLLSPYAFAQDTTPVRTAGQTSPGMEVPLNLPTTQIKQEAALRSPSALHTHQQGRADSELIPWWEGAEAVALESMKVNSLSFAFTISAGIEYDDNLYLDNDVNGSKGGETAYFGRLSSEVIYDRGPLNFSLAYTPEYRIYGSGDVNDGFNQSGSFLASYVTGKTSLGLSISISQTDGADIEIGDRVDAISANATFNISYNLSVKTAVGASLSTQIMDYDEFNSFGVYTFNGYLDYKFSPKTTLGLSTGYSHSEVDEGTNANAYNSQIRLAWMISDKLSILGSAGAEFREFDGGKNLVSPIYSVGAVYTISELTSIGLDSYRRNTPSVSEIDQSYYSTGVLLSLNQRLREKINLSLGLGYENAQYEASTDQADASRDESYFYIRPQITYNLGENITLTMYYQYSQNDANDDGRSFDRNLIGASINYTF